MLRLKRGTDDRAREERLALFLAVCSGVVAAAGFVVAGSIVPGFTGTFLKIVGACALAVHLQDVQRYLCFAAGKMGEAILLDATWLVVQVAITVGLVLDGSNSPDRLIWAWGTGAVVSAGIGLARRRLRPSPRGLRGWLAVDGTRAVSFLGDFVVSTGMVQAAFLLLGVVLTLGEFGALRLAFVSLSPLANALAGVRALTLAHYAGLRTDPLGARNVARKVAIGLAGMGAAYGALVVLVPVDAVIEVLGPTWADAHALVGFVAVGEVLRLSTFPAIDLLKVFAAPATLVRVRIVAAAGVVAGLLAGALLGGPTAAAVCVAIAYAVATTTWWRAASPRALAAAPAGVLGDGNPGELAEEVELTS